MHFDQEYHNFAPIWSHTLAIRFLDGICASMLTNGFRNTLGTASSCRAMLSVM